jgi:hypothetical protein
MAHGRHRAGRAHRGGSGLAAHLSTQGQGIPATTTKRLTASLKGGYVRTHLFQPLAKETILKSYPDLSPPDVQEDMRPWLTDGVATSPVNFDVNLLADLFGFDIVAGVTGITVNGYLCQTEELLPVIRYCTQWPKPRPLTSDAVNAAVVVLRPLVQEAFCESGMSVYQAFAAYCYAARRHSTANVQLSWLEVYAANVVAAFILNGACVKNVHMPRGDLLVQMTLDMPEKLGEKIIVTI